MNRNSPKDWWWPSISLKEPGDYAGGIGEKYTKDPEVNTNARGRRARLAHELNASRILCAYEAAESPPELDEIRAEHQATQVYKNLPEDLKDELAAGYGRCMGFLLDQVVWD